MTDYRDPNYRDPNRPGYRDPSLPADASWSTATWGWIAGISVVVLVLIFAFGMGGDGDRTAKDTTRPPATTGQRTVPPAPPAGAPSRSPIHESGTGAGDASGQAISPIGWTEIQRPSASPGVSSFCAMRQGT